MKTGENFSKIGSTGIVLILFFAVLLFTLLGLRLGIASPVHASTRVSAACAAPSITISPTSGPAGQSTTVSGTGVQDSTSTTATCPPLASGTVTFGIGTTDCSSPTSAGSASMNTDGSGSFSSSFTWPTTGTGSTAGTYQVCVGLGGGNGTIDAGTFTVTSSSSSSASVSVDSSSYTVGQWLPRLDISNSRIAIVRWKDHHHPRQCHHRRHWFFYAGLYGTRASAQVRSSQSYCWKQHSNF